jgi:hypothetical protein
MPVAPNQGDILFDPATSFDWSRFWLEGSISPSTTGMYNPSSYNPVPYNPSPNPEMNTSAMGGLGMYFGQDNSLGFEALDESRLNNLWEKYNSDAR